MLFDHKVTIKYIDTSERQIIQEWPVKDSQFVEELMFEVLEKLGVGPIYALMFGLKLIKNKKTNCWLAPNTKFNQLFAPQNLSSSATPPPTSSSSSSSSGKAKKPPVVLILAIRFIPSSISRLRVVDEVAFNLLFAQIRHDFLNNRRVFSNQKKSHLLVDNKILSLIAADILRKTVELGVKPDEIYNYIDYKDVVPRAASKWQRPLVFHLKKHLQLDKSIENYTEYCPKDVKLIKQGFIEHFIRNVCVDYRIETYDITGVYLPFNPKKMIIRVVYRQTRENTECFIEAREALPDKEWILLCDIQSICYASLHEDEIVEINRSNGKPYRMSFDSPCLAKSFLSLIDGYNRLMNKWHSVHFCQQVLSPDLEFLNKNKIHGPICVEYELSNKKRRSGTFLVKRSMKNYNTYIIDAILEANLFLEVEVVFNRETKSYTIGKSELNKKEINLNLLSSEYKDLKTLISDIEIIIEHEESGTGRKFKCPPYQLTHWVAPSEYDDYLLNMICMSKLTFKKLLESREKKNIVINSLNELPRYIPASMLEFDSNRIPFDSNDNGLLVRQARFNKEHKVIVKEYLDNSDNNTNINCSSCNSRTPNTCTMIRNGKFSHRKTILCLSGNTRQEQSAKDYYYENNENISTEFRLVDWMFIKHPLFAETIGLTRNDDMKMNKSSFVQEFLTNRLDIYLSSRSKCIKEKDLKIICCQIACALLFLQDKRMVHGKLRCHNIYLKNTSPMIIKITDPLGTVNVRRDLAFIPPEYNLIGNENIIINEFNSGFDVWSFGTVLWQIFSFGMKPPKERYANTLIKPKSCPSNLWDLAESCWKIDPTHRATPQTIYRDLNDSFDRQQESSSLHYYHSLDTQEQQQQIIQDSQINGGDGTLARGMNLALWDFELISTSNGTTINSLALDPRGASSTRSDESDDTEAFLVNQQSKHDINNNSFSNQNYYYLHKNERQFEKSKFQQHKGQFYYSIKKFFALPSHYRGEQNGTPHHIQSNQTNLTTLTTPSLNELDNLNSATSNQSIYNNLNQLDSNSTNTSTSLSTSINSIDDIDNSNWKIPPELLTTMSEIGKGQSGVVMKGVLSEWKGHKDAVVAIKVLNNHNLNEPTTRENFMREFDILRKLKHENIVKTLGYLTEPEVKFVVEYMPLGSLLSYLRNWQHIQLANLPLQKYALDIASGMEYLESKSIVHRDLASRNVLVKSQTQVKICDFGLAQTLESDQDHYKVKTNRPLPICWCAPEALYPTWEFSTKSDVWSYGIVLWEIYSGGCSPKYGFDQMNLREALKYKRLLRPKNCPEYMYYLMHLCWAYKPEDRISFSEICDRIRSLPELDNTCNDKFIL